MKLFIFGLGYSATYVARRLAAGGVAIAGTVRSQAKADLLSGAGYAMRLFVTDQRDAAIARELADSDAVLVSVPPGAQQDPVLQIYRDDLAAASHLRWIGYLSTVGVYGDHGGGWVDETTVPTPMSEASRRRLDVERQWLDFGDAHRIPVHIFRLAGIYGPGRNQLVQLAEGKARRIVKPGHVFNRIHVEDIAQIVEASLGRPRAGAIYNGADNERLRRRMWWHLPPSSAACCRHRTSRTSARSWRRCREPSSANASGSATRFCATSWASRCGIRPFARD